jgi:Osmosensitive K+ channel His kinase sensor domain
VRVLLGEPAAGQDQESARTACTAARTVTYRDASLAELDVGAVLDRRPGLALVDELAHANPPGQRHARRWQDVGELAVLFTVGLELAEGMGSYGPIVVLFMLPFAAAMVLLAARIWQAGSTRPCHTASAFPPYAARAEITRTPRAM